MPVFETFPYTNFHELNLDWLLGEVKKWQSVYDGIPAEIDKYLKDVGSPHTHTMTGYRLYVGGITGDDKNDGISPSRPVKTLAQAFNIFNGHTAIGNIDIIEQGEYLIPDATIGACEFHLNARCPNVTIKWLEDPANTTLKTIYNAYVHLQGYSDGSTVFHISGTGENRAYLECGKMFAQYITFESDGTNFGIIGANGTFADCIFKTKAYVRQGCFNFNGCKFMQVNDDNAGAAMLDVGYSSVISLPTPIEFIDVNADTTPYLVQADRAVMFITVTPTVTNPTGAPEYLHATRSHINGSPVAVRSWIYNTGTVENCTVLGKWFRVQTDKAGYDSLLITADAVKGTHYAIDPNAKSLTLKMELIESGTVLARSSFDIDLGAVDFSQTQTFTSLPFIYFGALTSNVPFIFWINGDTFSTGEICYNHSYGSSLDATSSANTDTYIIKVGIYQNF